MSKKISPAKLGVFVLVAIALGLATIAVISSGQLFKKTVPFVMYFEKDATGLKPGAPVLFRGVAIGQVTKIQLVFDSDRQDMLVPVYISVDPNRFVLKGNSDHYPMMEDLVEQGLRAQLQTQSFVTGMLQVSLVHMPDIPVDLKGADPSVREIPTAPALTQMLAEEVKDIDFSEISKDLQETVKGLKAITQQIQEDQVFQNLSGVLANLESLTEGLSEDLPSITEDLTKTSASVRKLVEKGTDVLTHAESIVAEVDKKAPKILQSTEENAEKFEHLQEALTNAIVQAEGMLSQDSPFRFHIAAALDRYTKLAAKLETFIDTLERNPEAILTGKPKQN